MGWSLSRWRMARITAGTIARGRFGIRRRPGSRRRADPPARSARASPARGRSPRAWSAHRSTSPRLCRVTATSSSTVTAPCTSASATACSDSLRPDSTAPGRRRPDGRLDHDPGPASATVDRLPGRPASPRQPEVVEQLRDPGHDAGQVVPVAQEPVAAGGGRGVDRSRARRSTRGPAPAPTRRSASAPLRAPASTTTTASADAADQPVPLRERALRRLDARARTPRRPRRPPPTIASARRSWARGKSRACPPPMNATVAACSATTAACAAPSMPTASPETDGGAGPREGRRRSGSRSVDRPARPARPDDRDDVLVARATRVTPRTNSAGGGSSIASRRRG